jgi:hypothetical protein
MSTIESRIAKSARSEFPETWAALAKSNNYGEDVLISKIELVEESLFGAVQTDTDLTTVRAVVIDYAGKLVALKCINAGIDYWSKQVLMQVAGSGRTETKTWKDRSSDLVKLRADLLEQVDQLWPDVQALLPNRQTRRAGSIPRARQIVGVNTPDPDLFGSAFENTNESTGTVA